MAEPNENHCIENHGNTDNTWYSKFTKQMVINIGYAHLHVQFMEYVAIFGIISSVNARWLLC